MDHLDVAVRCCHIGNPHRGCSIGLSQPLKTWNFEISQMFQKNYLWLFKRPLTILRGQNDRKFQIMKISNFHLNDHFSHFKQLFDNIHYFLGFPMSNFPNSFYECPFCHDYFLQVHLTRFTPQKHFLKIT